jgi:hypothetical protein
MVMLGGYMVFWQKECVCWVRPYEVRDITETFICTVDAVNRVVTLV